MKTKNPTVKCSPCGASIANAHAALLAGWYASEAVEDFWAESPKSVGIAYWVCRACHAAKEPE